MRYKGEYTSIENTKAMTVTKAQKKGTWMQIFWPSDTYISSEKEGWIVGWYHSESLVCVATVLQGVSVKNPTDPFLTCEPPSPLLSQTIHFVTGSLTMPRRPLLQWQPVAKGKGYMCLVTGAEKVMRLEK